MKGGGRGRKGGGKGREGEEKGGESKVKGRMGNIMEALNYISSIYLSFDLTFHN